MTIKVEQNMNTRPKFEKDFIFVLMPFTKDLDDLYIYGIRGPVEESGYSCIRADEIEHNTDNLQEILSHIERAKLIIAETTDKNPNVFYEIGIAHEKGKKVILLIRRGVDIPFDLKSKNHIIYDSIHDLAEKISNRLYASRSDAV